ncbi:hypothetical protein IRJ41_012081 [Triplophysa rosa]|uniref:Uncharacterized protein n=1 Tax=Triplophysa rosa TaxID=992332 RepID=A0A9W8C6F0_TRIRA|nr:hypothetical protein IRJ41_012081 [Triplophysa rosa]
MRNNLQLTAISSAGTGNLYLAANSQLSTHWCVCSRKHIQCDISSCCSCIFYGPPLSYPVLSEEARHSCYLSGCRYWCLPLCRRGDERKKRTSARYPPLASPSPCSLSLHPSFLPPGPPVSGRINPPAPSSYNPFDYPHFTVPSHQLCAGKTRAKWDSALVL